LNNSGGDGGDNVRLLGGSGKDDDALAFFLGGAASFTGDGAMWEYPLLANARYD
jgi:hypothetical protein